MKTHLIAVLAMLVLAPGCATQELWDHTNPRERLFIDRTQTTEDKLRARHVSFSRCKDEHWDGYLVEKSQMRKLGDITLRTLGTPVTLVVDAAATVLVTGVIIFAEAAKDDPEGTSAFLNMVFH